MNMYQVGGSLPENFSGYVRRQADEELYERVKNHEYCYVLNARQMGKSSLRVQTMKRLRADGIACAEVDITRIGASHQGAEKWLGAFTKNLVRSFGLAERFDLRTWQRQHDDLTPLYRLSLFIEEVLLREVTQPIVIFIDEIDSVLNLDFKDDLFGLIRACCNQRTNNLEFRRLTFVLLGVATPADLISDTSRTPFNIGRAIELQGFRLHEAKPLAQGVQEKADNPQEVLKQILGYTGGQPFLTHKLCQMVEAGERIPDGEESAHVKNLVKLRIVQNWESESQDDPQHLRTIRDKLLKDKTRSVQRLTLYQQILQNNSIPADDSLEQMDLRFSGLVVQHQGKLKVYNPIYRCVFNENWVDGQLSQQRPYADNLRAWKESGGQDRSQLLQGQALREVQTWADDKRLSADDYEYLNASFRWEADQIVAEARREAQLQEQQAKAAEAKATEADHRLRETDQILNTARYEAMQQEQRAKIAEATANEADHRLKTKQHQLEQAEKQVIEAEQQAVEAEKHVAKEKQKAKRWTIIGSGAIAVSALVSTAVTIGSSQSVHTADQRQKTAEEKQKSAEQQTVQLNTQVDKANKKLKEQKVEFLDQKAKFSSQLSQQRQQLISAQDQKEQAENQRQKAQKQTQSIERNLQALNKALQQNKENLSDIWGISRSVSLMSKKKYMDALYELERLLERNPQNNFAWVAKGFAYYEMEQYEEALKCYEQALEINDNDALAFSQKGNTLFKLGRIEEAISSYDQAIEINPNYVEAWNDKGIAWLTLGNVEKAIESYNRATKINPDYAEAWYNKGNALFQSRAFEKAIENYSRATEINPNHASAWLGQGRALSMSGIERIDEAIDSYNEALKVDRSRIATWYFLGIALRQRGDVQAATESFERAITISPNSAEGWYFRGIVLYQKREHQAAAESFDRAIEINPNYADAWRGRADALFNQEATDNLLTLPVPVPGNSLSNQRPVVIERPHPIILSVPYPERTERALDSYNRAIEIDPKHANAWYGRGNALLRLGRPEAAIASYSQALQLNPSYERAWYGLGNAQFRLGRTEESLASYDRATEINPKYTDVWYNRGIALLKLERYEDALASANRAIELNPEMGVAIRLREETLRHIGRMEDVNVPEQ